MATPAFLGTLLLPSAVETLRHTADREAWT